MITVNTVASVIARINFLFISLMGLLETRPFALVVQNVAAMKIGLNNRVLWLDCTPTDTRVIEAEHACGVNQMPNGIRECRKGFSRRSTASFCITFLCVPRVEICLLHSIGPSSVRHGRVQCSSQLLTAGSLEKSKLLTVLVCLI